MFRKKILSISSLALVLVMATQTTVFGETSLSNFDDSILISVDTSISSNPGITSDSISTSGSGISTDSLNTSNSAITPDNTESKNELSNQNDSDKTYAKLNSIDHMKYMNGNTSGMFCPSDNLSRAEAATILFSLLTEKGQPASHFSDVADSAWYANSVNTLASMNILKGYGDTFAPNKSISRAELVLVLSRFFDYETVKKTFSDVPSTHFAAQAISFAADNGWVNGYPDGTFMPDKPVTRAETTVIINAVLNRTPDKNYISQNTNNMRFFPDVALDNWAYYSIMEASTDHNFKYPSGSSPTNQPPSVETGSGSTSSGSAISDNPGVTSSGSAISDNPSVTSSGSAITDNTNVNISDANTTPSGASLRKWIDYPEDEVWTSFTEVQGTFSEGFHLINGELMYVGSDKKFVRNASVGSFNFDNNGHYTTGNIQLDSYLTQIVKTRTNSGMTQSEKLRVLFQIVRDEYTYIKRPNVSYGATGWENEYALNMFTDKKGNCYGYAAAFYHLAKKIGYDCYPVSGVVGHKRSPHGWVVIPENGINYIYDTELEMAYKAKGVYYNLYKMTPGKTPFIYA